MASLFIICLHWQSVPGTYCWSGGLNFGALTKSGVAKSHVFMGWLRKCEEIKDAVRNQCLEDKKFQYED